MKHQLYSRTPRRYCKVCAIPLPNVPGELCNECSKYARVWQRIKDNMDDLRDDR